MYSVHCTHTYCFHSSPESGVHNRQSLEVEPRKVYLTFKDASAHALLRSPFTIARTQRIYCCAIWLISNVSVWGSTIKRGVYSSFSDYISVFTLVLSAILQHVRIASSALRLPLAKPYMWEGKKQAPSAWTQLGVSTHWRLFGRPIPCLRIKILNFAQDRSCWVLKLWWRYWIFITVERIHVHLQMIQVDLQMSSVPIDEKQTKVKAPDPQNTTLTFKVIHSQTREKGGQLALSIISKVLHAL